MEMFKGTEFQRRKIIRELKSKDRGIVDFIKILHHFFKDLSTWINQMKDPRNRSYVTYEQSDLVYAGILKNVCSAKTMRQMGEKFNEETCIRTFGVMTGHRELQEMPHPDTLNWYLEQVSPEDIAKVRRNMIKKIIRMNSFSRGKLNGVYWRVVLDGTGLFYFKEKHCENCLVTTIKKENGKIEKRYYHKVLEAKLVLSKKLVLSFDTEFIENEKEDVSKQDCEINAAKRMLERMKKEYPKLPVCIQGDALYAAEPIMELCRNNHWGYLLTQKENRQKQLAEAYEWIKAGGETKKQKIKIKKENGWGMYVNHVEETAGKKERANMYEYRYQKKKKDGAWEEITFQWITNIEINDKNLKEMIEAGRGRWNIENEGFNRQKHGIYEIEHKNSHNNNAMKNHYIITQITEIIMQLYMVAWNPLLKQIKQTMKETSSRLLESFRGHSITQEDEEYIARHTKVHLEY